MANLTTTEVSIKDIRRFITAVRKEYTGDRTEWARSVRVIMKELDYACKRAERSGYFAALS